MRWLFARWRPDRASLVCYLRENGPIAYATPLFDRAPRERAEAILATGLTWYWQTTSASVVDREWTELSRWSLAALLADLAAAREGARPRVLVIAIDAQDSPDAMTDARVAAWMRAFATAAPGPLHAVVSHPAPGGDLVFVAQQPAEPIRGLLAQWCLDRGKARRRAYARLHGAGLEDLTRLLTARS